MNMMPRSKAHQATAVRGSSQPCAHRGRVYGALSLDVIARERHVRSLALALAGKTGLDPRTCRGALERGAGALRSVADQELIALAADELGISLPLEGC